jgi:threonine/homoserine/homoserine lactone efflux protein
VEELRALLSMVLMSLAVMGSPGPSNLSASAVGAAFGARRALAYVAGLVLGTTAVLAAVAAGVVAMLMSVPRLAPVLVGASAVYLAWLAFKIATAPPLSASGAGPRAPSFAGGVLLGIANPKAYFSIAAVFAGTTLTAEPGLDARLKIAALIVMIVVIHAIWLTSGIALARLLRHPVAARVVNLAFAAVLVGTTVLMLLRA